MSTDHAANSAAETSDRSEILPVDNACPHCGMLCDGCTNDDCPGTPPRATPPACPSPRELMARRIFGTAIAEHRCAELLETLFAGGSATVQLDGELVIVSANVLKGLYGEELAAEPDPPEDVPAGCEELDGVAWCVTHFGIIDELADYVDDNGEPACNMRDDLSDTCRMVPLFIRSGADRV